MSSTVTKHVPPSQVKQSTTGASGPAHFDITPYDVELFERHLRSFVPTGSFDAHGHLYEHAHLGPTLHESILAEGPKRADWSTYQRQVSRWMGDRTPSGGLFFAFPRPDIDMPAANRFLAAEMARHECLRGLLLVRPGDKPADAQAQLEAHGFAGFKVYLVYAEGPLPYQAEIGQFLPEWVWELADERELVIMLHVVKHRAVADPVNQQYIREHCVRYPGARLVLAHCARSFNAGHALEGLASLSGLDNVYFDNSAICEPQSAQEILRLFGPTRLMFALDFPVSELRGRAVSVADGFLWLDHKNVDWSKAAFGGHTIIGIENLLALKQACRAMHLTDEDVEYVFFRTARQLLGIDDSAPGAGQALYRKARQIIPGGTQLLSKRPEMFAPERWPAYYREARGVTVVDLDGRHYTDMSYMGIGACLLGYADPDVTAAVVRRVQWGAMCTLNVAEEVELARLLIELHPWAENVRFARTGGESLAVAVRIARAATGHDKVAICGYHGWHDWYLATNLVPLPDASSSGTGVSPAGDRLAGHLLPGLDPAGVPAGLTGTTLPFRYDQLDELEAIFESTRGELAAVVMEPTRSVDPAPGFLEGVRELCDRHGTKLVFDEVSIGWKLAVGGAHLKYRVNPDLAVFAKSISNGHAMGAVIGRASAMQAAQSTFISSAYWTEGVGPAAALAAVRKMTQVDVVSHVARIGRLVKQAWLEAAARHHLPLKVGGHDCLCSFTLDDPQARALETLFIARMLDRSFLATPAIHMSLAHEPRHIEAYARALDPVFAELSDAIRNGDAERRLGSPVRQSGFARLT